MIDNHKKTTKTSDEIDDQTMFDLSQPGTNPENMTINQIRVEAIKMFIEKYKSLVDTITQKIGDDPSCQFSKRELRRTFGLEWRTFGNKENV